MARPQVLHKGFFVPNASSVSNPRMAEPDKVDFSTAANSRWGVIEGCEVTCGGHAVHVDAGTVVVNGVMLPVAEVSTGLTVDGGGANDRFDLIAVNEGGVVIRLAGTPAVDPVYPDVPLTATVLAAIFCTATGGFDDNVIDKRKFLPKSLLTKINASDPLVRNLNGSGDHFRINGDGEMTWGTGFPLAKAVGVGLRIEKSVDTDALHADVITGDSLAVTGLVTGSNLSRTTPRPATAPIGAIYQDPTTGVPSYYDGSAWQAISSADVLLPPGTVITSINPPGSMPGWVRLDGTPISEASAARLFLLPALSNYITGIAPNRTMTLPSAVDRVLMGGQVALATGGRKTVTITEGQMPRHKHSVKTVVGGGGAVSGKTGWGGSHIHAITGGRHYHTIYDPGHRHNGGDYPFGGFIALAWGGNNKIDALFNDRNHTYSVESCEWVRSATTGIDHTEPGEHFHEMDAGNSYHEHSIVMNPQPDHLHATEESNVGNNEALDITPPYLTLFVYIKA